MRKEFVILAAIAMITVSAVAAVAVANLADDPANSQQIKGLTYDVKAQSRMTALDAVGDADVQLLNYSEEPPDDYFYFEMPYDEHLSCRVDTGYAVLFTPPRPFIVDGVVINGWYHNESGSVPFTVELRNEKGGLLYKLTDISVAYFPSKPGSWSAVIEIPAIRIDGAFAVIFYSRTSVSVGAYVGTSNSTSSFVVKRDVSMSQALTPEGKSLKWAISAAGRDG